MARPSKMQLRFLGARRPAAEAAPSVGRAHGKRPALIIADSLDERQVRAQVDRALGFRSSIDENRERIAKLDKALKGKQGCNCNVTACQRPNAWFYNGGTHAWYCFDCAWDIRKFNDPERDGYTLFPQWEDGLARYETEVRFNNVAREAYVAERLRA